ncbi:hypothetical protein ACSSS7_005206 [Eimeria intestinalis]
MLDPTSDSEYEVRIAKHEFARAVCEKHEEWVREALDPAFSNEFFRRSFGSHCDLREEETEGVKGDTLLVMNGSAIRDGETLSKIE